MTRMDWEFCILARRLLAVFAAILAHCANPATATAQEAESARLYADCSAYFFMAANAKPMTTFDGYYRAGEFAYNKAVQLVGEPMALERFNGASMSINELIERNWSAFKKADDRYGVICADIFRDATNPDP